MVGRPLWKQVSTLKDNRKWKGGGRDTEAR